MENNEEYYQNLISQITDLISRSEDRVDRTNDIISKAFVMLDKITTEYTIQIRKLQESRDELIKQNASLIKIVEEIQNTLQTERLRYETLLDKTLHMASNSSENNINVH